VGVQFPRPSLGVSLIRSEIMKIKKSILVEGHARVSHIDGSVTIHDVPRKTFNELKVIGIHDKKDDTEWVCFGGVTFYLSK